MDNLIVGAFSCGPDHVLNSTLLRGVDDILSLRNLLFGTCTREDCIIVHISQPIINAVKVRENKS